MCTYICRPRPEKHGKPVSQGYPSIVGDLILTSTFQHEDTSTLQHPATSENIELKRLEGVLSGNHSLVSSGRVVELCNELWRRRGGVVNNNGFRA